MDRRTSPINVNQAIRNSINYKIRNDLQPEDLETITIEICKPKAKSFLINTWYRPPGSTLELFKCYEQCIQEMDSENKEIILVGDFNADWSNSKITAQTKMMWFLALHLVELILEC